ncbi:hypothetical protein DFA_09845 [Cavenderia fasciculata]|uniref:DUF4209 domain-containing protein n=1 Tax=Cavenderia fasciculata TaxID=261658 RepID=F4QAW4_CACFS|nr:uncharacterized protein DFA_09845 [Cavenderia fasciculata]EGG15023.1 hypothetical protein DFA_09845 [Cavenderia fasciculata]|eukprot:XP_004351743.1 hypothetical protein DFA_09845 [Cavenderia fasciculata]
MTIESYLSKNVKDILFKQEFDIQSCCCTKEIIGGGSKQQQQQLSPSPHLADAMVQHIYKHFGQEHEHVQTNLLETYLYTSHLVRYYAKQLSPSHQTTLYQLDQSDNNESSFHYYLLFDNVEQVEKNLLSFSNIIKQQESEFESKSELLYIESLVFLSIYERLINRLITYGWFIRKKENPTLVQPLIPGRMLRDLLVDENLEFVIGVELVTILKVIIGPPIGMNLRNVLWHGFMSPTELDSSLIIFLLSLFHSIILKFKQTLLNHSTNLESLNIDNNNQLFKTVNYNQKYQHLIYKFKDYNKFELKEIFNRLKESKFIINGREELWKIGFNYYDLDRYYSLVTLLPQLEHSIRCLFVETNGLSDQFLVADYKSYYTTLDIFMSEQLSLSNEQLQKTIIIDQKDNTTSSVYYKYDNPKFKDNSNNEKLESEKQDIDNQLIKTLGDEIIASLLDLFIYPDGPRIRDKLSHGEVDIKSISSFILNFTIHTIDLISLKLIKKKYKEEKEKEEKETTTTTTIVSLFNTISIGKLKMEQLNQNINQLKEFKENLENQCKHLKNEQDLEQETNQEIKILYEYIGNRKLDSLLDPIFEKEQDKLIILNDNNLFYLYPTIKYSNHIQSIRKIIGWLIKLVDSYLESGKTLYHNAVNKLNKNTTSFYKWYGLVDAFIIFITVIGNHIGKELMLNDSLTIPIQITMATTKFYSKLFILLEKLFIKTKSMEWNTVKDQILIIFNHF